MNPDQARAAVAKAKAKGILIVGPCEMTDETCHGQIEGHHDNYDKPLEVRWLCRRHHRFIHRGPRSAKKSTFSGVVTFKLELETVNELKRLAREGDRTFPQEIRRALRLHLLANALEAAKSDDLTQEEGATA